ncbi:MAG TPA: hypothetical protein VKT25_11175 [Ktedonobacteraceae bacterium]|nr:hypothetical protein [Ktedonobacteraceae bacterium]
MNYTSDNGAGAGQSSSFVSRREMRANNPTGMLPVVSPGRSVSGAPEIENLIASLKELFAQDRQLASQQDSTRCGICYLHFTVSELYYREEEGFYVCQGCERALGKNKVPMVRRQQK